MSSLGAQVEDPRESFNVRKMLSGQLFHFDENNGALLEKAQRLTNEFNAITDKERQDAILHELLGSRGKNCWMTPTIGFDYGWNTHVGENFYANMGLVVLDGAKVTIGDNCMIGPRVSLVTASHPLSPVERAAGYEINAPITIGDNVWIGAHVVVNPGVTIGDNTVIGSSSVVTKDVPSGVIAAGNPCRVLREIDEAEVANWQAQVAEYQRDRG